MGSRVWVGGSIVALVCLAACGDSSPTGSSPLPDVRTIPGTSAQPQGSPGSGSGTSSSGAMSAMGPMGASDTEEFNCQDVETTRVRFGSPGYVEDDRVGLYVYFGGMATGAKRLRIWWDIENDPVTYRDFVFDERETEIEEVYEHRYTGLTGPVQKLARVELIRDGLTGNCARNRRVEVAPPIVSGSPSSPAAATTKTANVGPTISAIDFVGIGVEGVQFTVLTSLSIDSVWVQPNGSGNLVIKLMDGTGSTVLASRTLAVAPGNQQVSLGFNVTPGSYQLALDASALLPAGAGAGATNFWGASYPYTLAGVISLDDTLTPGFGTWFGYYHYLYDWQVTW
jgi:hypothetical protein